MWIWLWKKPVCGWIKVRWICWTQELDQVCWYLLWTHCIYTSRVSCIKKAYYIIIAIKLRVIWKYSGTPLNRHSSIWQIFIVNHRKYTHKHQYIQAPKNVNTLLKSMSVGNQTHFCNFYAASIINMTYYNSNCCKLCINSAKAILLFYYYFTSQARVSFRGGGTCPPLRVATNHIHNTCICECEWK